MESNAPPPPARDAIELACSMKEELLAEIEELGDRLPPNTLDQLIDELGGPENVAEVSALFSPSLCFPPCIESAGSNNKPQLIYEM